MHAREDKTEASYQSSGLAGCGMQPLRCYHRWEVDRREMDCFDQTWLRRKHGFDRGDNPAGLTIRDEDSNTPRGDQEGV